MPHQHVAVVIDHHEAKVLHVDESEAVEVRAHHHNQAHKEGHKPGPDAAFFAEIERALADAEHIILMGPGTAKQEFVHHLERHAPAVAARIYEVLTIDRPTDRQVSALAREHFKKLDRMDGKHVG